ncbi:unnamed protein product [Caenorhabditis bovis]|uniref:Uncharacterized protein n=1 Tax=Caenorhabditis bovis TaxID=2654633 RepID=A0A8S1F8L8_9PELO|nr:unnamed protein product [Caenorhabditis bovis]
MDVISNETLPLWFDYLEAASSYSLMFVALITVNLYWMEIIILLALRNSFYKGMFYRIFTIGIIVDMISLINNYVGCVFPAKEWFIDYYLSLGTTVGHLYLIIAWTSRGIQGCTVVALALNRATAVCLPVRHKRIWSSPWAPCIHIFQIGIGLMIGSALIPRSFYWKHERVGYYIQFEDKKFRLNFFLAAYLIESIFVTIIVIINITMLVYFKKKYRMRTINAAQKANYNRKVMSEKQRQENSLTIVAIVTCVAELIYYLYVIYAFGINTNVPTRIFYMGYNLINDCYCSLSGWLFLISSAPMRKHIMKMLKFPTQGCKNLKNLENNVSSATNMDGYIRNSARNTSARRVQSFGTQF